MDAVKLLLKKILWTEEGAAISLMRAVLGWIFIKEGAGKLFGWFGGGGWEATCAYFQTLKIPFPELQALLVGNIEFLGGIALLLGFFTRLAAIPIAITMVVAIFTAHKEGGYYYPLVIFVSCLVLIQVGSGRHSLDKLLAGRET